MANVQTTNSGGQWITAILSLATGVFLIVFHKHLDLITWIVAATGWLILLSGLYLIVANVARQRQERDIWQAMAGVAALALGLWVAVAPSTFSHLMIYLFAIILVAAGVWHVTSLRIIDRNVGVPVYFYIIPVLLILAGVCFLVAGAQIVTTAIVLVTGIALVCSAAVTVMEMMGNRRCQNTV